MKGSPRSLWLSAANRATSWWTAAATSAAKRQQASILKSMLPKAPTASPAKPKRRSPKA